MKHKDNYVKAKMEEEITKSLHCLKEIIRYLKESQERISEFDSPEWNNTDRIYDKAFTYDKVLETIQLYFPNKVKEIEE